MRKTYNNSCIFRAGHRGSKDTMPWHQRILRASLAGAGIGGLVVFLGDLLAMIAAAMSMPGGRWNGESQDAGIRVTATLIAAAVAIVLLLRREPWGRRTQSAILGAAGGALLVLVNSAALESTVGSGPVRWQPPGWSLLTPRTLAIAEWAILSLPAALLLGATTGWTISAAGSHPAAVSAARRSVESRS